VQESLDGQTLTPRISFQVLRPAKLANNDTAEFNASMRKPGVVDDGNHDKSKIVKSETVKQVSEHSKRKQR
jgi:hypothetical protein